MIKQWAKVQGVGHNLYGHGRAARVLTFFGLDSGGPEPQPNPNPSPAPAR